MSDIEEEPTITPAIQKKLDENWEDLMAKLKIVDTKLYEQIKSDIDLINNYGIPYEQIVAKRENKKFKVMKEDINQLKLFE